MENPGDTISKQKAPETSSSAQALQVVTGVPPTSTVAGSTPATLAQTTPLPRVVGSGSGPHKKRPLPLMWRLPRRRPKKLSPVPVPPIGRRLDTPPPVPQEVPPHWLAHLECLQKGLQDVRCQIGGAPEDERHGIPFTKTVMADELPVNCRTPAITEYDGTTDPLEHLAHFKNAALLHSSRRLRKIELSLFAVRQKDNEPLKEYLQRFNTAVLESLAKKPVSKFDALLARAAKYINMEDAQAAKKESPGEKMKEVKEETPSKKPRNEFREKKAPYQRINTVYTPLTSDKFYRFHDDYGHTTEECRHLKNEIKRLIQNGRPIGGDSHHARKAEIKKAHNETITEVLDVETVEDTPIIQFERAEHSGPKSSHNDALVITALLANYEVGRIFIDSGSSGDILFRRPFRSNAVGRYPSRRDQYISLLFRGRSSSSQRFNLTALNIGDRAHPKDGQKRSSNVALEEVPFSKKGREGDPEGDSETDGGTPPKVQPIEELLNIELIPGDPEKVTQIGSQMNEAIRKEIIQCLRCNIDIFAWTPHDLQGINPEVITHHLNINPRVKPVKQNKRHFGPEKDKIIQAEIDKLVAAGHVEEIQFPEWLSNVVLIPKPGGKWRMCIDFKTSTRLVLKSFTPYPE
ncbi:UNVERIFIED_CONTAM: hypothetical protein Slati_3150600 [Sesamum latifolium]|uniref:Retrotransposon gag domain-containing protein n=1 Tax=Sesamum latifolium TaxID=2727402 RepID=A0AAW2UXX5_9LAMI